MSSRNVRVLASFRTWIRDTVGIGCSVLKSSYWSTDFSFLFCTSFSQPFSFIPYDLFIEETRLLFLLTLLFSGAFWLHSHGIHHHLPQLAEEAWRDVGSLECGRTISKGMVCVWGGGQVSGNAILQDIGSHWWPKATHSRAYGQR